MNYFQIGKEYFEAHTVEGAREVMATLNETDALEFAEGVFMASCDAIMDTLRRRIVALPFDKQDLFWDKVRVLLDEIESE